MMVHKNSSTHQEVAQKAVRAAFWNYLSFGLGKALVLITTGILARMLTVEEFGIVGFAILVISYLTALKDFGLGSALIQRRENVEEAANTVFTMNIVLGGLLSILTYLIAPQAALYFRQPLVTPLLRVLGLTFLFNGFGSVHTAMLRRELSFKRKMIPDISRSLVKGIVSIGFALAGAGVWSLVIGQVASSVTGMVATWIVYPWRPRIRIIPGIAKTLLVYGLSIVGVDLIAIITDNLDYLIIGRQLGSVDLGLYTLAYRLPEMLVLNVLWVLAAVLFPAYSMVKDDDESLRKGFLITVRYIELIIVPICFGLFLAADPIVKVAFGEQWSEAIPIVRVLALFALINSIGFNVGDVYKAIGRPDILVKIELFVLVILIPILLTTIRYGLLGIAFGHLAVAVIHMIIRLALALRYIKITIKDILVQFRPALLAGAILILFAWTALQLTTSLEPLLRLLIVTFTGAGGYVGILWLIERETILSACRLVGLLPDKKSFNA